MKLWGRPLKANHPLAVWKMRRVEARLYRAMGEEPYSTYIQTFLNLIQLEVEAVV